MTIQEMLDKSLAPILDHMDGTYTVFVPRSKKEEKDCNDRAKRLGWFIEDKGNNGRKVEYTGQVIKPKKASIWIIKHCSECGDLNASPIYNYGKPHLRQCPPKNRHNPKDCYNKVIKEKAWKDLKPIKYRGKMYTLEDCSPSDLNSLNPIKKHIYGLKQSRKQTRLGLTKYENMSKQDVKKRKNYRKTYKVENRENINAWNRVWQKKQFAENPQFIMKRKINSVFKYAKKKYGKVVKNKPLSQYGININKLIHCLEREAIKLGKTFLQMVAENYQIDHIIPCAFYDLTKEEEFKKCNSFQNIRWLPALENASKNQYIRPQDLEIIKTLPREIYPEGFNLEVYQ